MNQERVASSGSSLFRRVVLWTLCFIGAAAAVRRIVALLIPATSPRVQQMMELDAQFSRRMGLTLAHVVPALIFVVLLPAWFSRRVRENAPAHRRLTWVLLVLGAVIGLTALPLVTQPVGGTTEVTAILFFDALFLFSLARAWVLFVRGDMDRHREWMMRAVAVLLGIATTRPVMGVFFATSRLTHLETRQFFGIAFWIGFSATYIAGEIYLQRHSVHSNALAQSGS
ncbi:putative membrane protein DUF2306 [Edaphobacter aggregans]|uniref:Putative membrane protein DUF2306 n=1 Tax=Edaphobacter aggregans TaxID=570835 RepID=A0A3R9R2X1_9BACT|nr:DUF2306 domain-containing protein [Edaphobacter aggregans]RSL16681.1 putative membrane protein DUF2306 [Edaphobacter aggregans]